MSSPAPSDAVSQRLSEVEKRLTRFEGEYARLKDEYAKLERHMVCPKDLKIIESNSFSRYDRTQQ